MKRKLNLIGMIFSLFATFLSVYSMAGSVRTVDIITLFCSGMLTGITIRNLVTMKKNA